MSYRVKRVLMCAILIGGLLEPLSLAAPRLKVDLPGKKIPIDSTIILKVQLEWPMSEGPYEINALEPKLENLTLEQQNQSQETASSVFQTVTYELRPSHLGTAVIYPFEINFRKSGERLWTPLGIPGQNMEVVEAFPIKMVLMILGFLMGLIGLGFMGFKMYQIFQKRNMLKHRTPVDSRQRIYAKAEESIATFSSPETKEKLNHWSHQLRTVVAAYYGLTAPVTTNAEILSRLKSQGVVAGEWNELSKLFEQLTEMQFARQDLPAQDLDRMQKTLLQYVRGKIIIGETSF